MSLNTFEQSLLNELRQHVGTREAVRATPRRRRSVRLAAGGLAAGGGLAAAAVALSIATNVVGPSAAYAVEAEPNGDVVVTVHDLSDAAGLQGALAAKGIDANITYVPGFSQSGGQARTPSGDGRAACDIELAKIDGGLTFTLGASQIAGGSELEIVTSGSSPSDVGSPVAVAWSGGGC
jgi:hypothetical protein